MQRDFEFDVDFLDNDMVDDVYATDIDPQAFYEIMSIHEKHDDSNESLQNLLHDDSNESLQNLLKDDDNNKMIDSEMVDYRSILTTNPNLFNEASSYYEYLDQLLYGNNPGDFDTGSQDIDSETESNDDIHRVNQQHRIKILSTGERVTANSSSVRASKDKELLSTVKNRRNNGKWSRKERIGKIIDTLKRKQGYYKVIVDEKEQRLSTKEIVEKKIDKNGKITKTKIYIDTKSRRIDFFGKTQHSANARMNCFEAGDYNAEMKDVKQSKTRESSQVETERSQSNLATNSTALFANNTFTASVPPRRRSDRQSCCPTRFNPC